MTNPGWYCPKCGGVYAPWVKRCEECPKGRESTASMESVYPCGCPFNANGTQDHNYNCPHFRLKL